MRKKEEGPGEARHHGKTSGALSDASGGEEDDKEKKDVSGLACPTRTCERLGRVRRPQPAVRGTTGTGAPAGEAGLEEGRPRDRPGQGLGRRVAHELAEFVGGDRVERMKTVDALLRGGYQQTAGKAFEFPDSLRDIRDDYDLVTDDKLADKMNAYANKKGDPAAAKECQRLLAIVDRIFAAGPGCKDFEDGTIKTEMMERPERVPHGAEPGRPRVQRQPQAAGRSQGARRRKATG